MPRTVDELVALFDLETIEDHLFRGRQPQTSMQRVFGGQVLGQALLAAHRTVPPERHVHSLHAYFIRPGDTAVPIVYDVETTRDGGSFTTRRVLARQHGKVIFGLTSSFQVDEPGPDHQDVMPDVPAPEGLPPLTSPEVGDQVRLKEVWEQEWAALDVRYAGSSRAGGTLVNPSHPAVARVWARVAGRLPDDPVLHRCVLAYLSDLTLLSASLVPHGLPMRPDRVQMASLDHAMWFHRPFRADGWLLYDQLSPSASGARGLSVGRMFDAAGSLVATVVQEGLIRPLPPRPARPGPGGPASAGPPPTEPDPGPGPAAQPPG